MHLATGAILVIIAAVLEATGNGGTVTTAMFGVGATLLPTAPSGLLRRQTGQTGTLIPDTLAAVSAGAAIAHGTVPVVPPGSAPVASGPVPPGANV